MITSEQSLPFKGEMLVLNSRRLITPFERTHSATDIIDTHGTYGTSLLSVCEESSVGVSSYRPSLNVTTTGNNRLDIFFSQINLSNVTCQKCLQKGHWTYQCKGKRKYLERESYTSKLDKKLESIEQRKSRIKSDQKRKQSSSSESSTESSSSSDEDSSVESDSSTMAETSSNSSNEAPDGSETDPSDSGSSSSTSDSSSSDSESSCEDHRIKKARK
ncbi:hypothetical protein P879_10000 [Paragonimus westermani]|uniref:Zinc finger CCHC domain-containing protein 10 n=1 Tax=Paragonimus westermani TaxID=34504 RepID=A0A8T0D1C1_9TREM|nr:hypothetical protein P879_10000 [Paragonimus westermani]